MKLSIATVGLAHPFEVGFDDAENLLNQTAKTLEEAGVIESAAAYDNYLYQNGYDKRIIAAVYEIPVDADEEQIARIITGRK